MKFSFLLLSLVFFLSGCGSSHSANVDPDEAGKVLRTALEAWKDGKNNSDLKSLHPSIIMNESDWTSGKILIEFKMNDAGVMDGRQVRWVVQIKLKDKDGNMLNRKATYIIDTDPRVVIVRDSFAS